MNQVKISKEKYDLAMARACLGAKELENAGIAKSTLARALRREVRPETAGRIARALGVDVTEIIEIEGSDEK